MARLPRGRRGRLRVLGPGGRAGRCGCLLVLAAESAQSLRPSALRALITVALHLRDAAEAVRRPAIPSVAW
ncbi:hypothetical protein R2F25_33695 [Streptomyces sp. UP1A-1]|nr:hypothetical protein [Streptomyces sp. UP1A-1]